MIDVTNMKSYEDFKNQIQKNLDEMYKVSSGNLHDFRKNQLEIPDEQFSFDKIEKFEELERENLYLISIVLTNKLSDKYLYFDNTNTDDLFINDCSEKIIAKPKISHVFDTPNFVKFSTCNFAKKYTEPDTKYTCIHMGMNTFNEDYLFFYDDADEYIRTHSIDDFFNYFEQKIISKDEFIEKFKEFTQCATNEITSCIK